MRLADGRRVELVLGHRHLERAGRLRWPSAAARGDQRQCHQRPGECVSHRNSVTPRKRIQKRKIHTTSTKCQYKVTAATPTWCWDENCPRAARNRMRMSRIRPPSTCRPWKPVIVKKALAKVFACSVRPRANALMNSYSCPASNPKPRMIVTICRRKNWRRLSCAIASLAKWHVTPLDSRMIVLTNGIGHQLT